jgi:hypothetical protein
VLATLGALGSAGVAGCDEVAPPSDEDGTPTPTPVRLGTETALSPTQTAAQGTVEQPAPRGAVERVETARDLLRSVSSSLAPGVVFRLQRVAIGAEDGFAEWDRLSPDDLRDEVAGAQAATTAARGLIQTPAGSLTADEDAGELSLTRPLGAEAVAIAGIYEQVAAYLRAKLRFYAATVAAFRGYPDAVRAAAEATTQSDYDRATTAVKQAVGRLDTLETRLRTIQSKRARLPAAERLAADAAIPGLDPTREEREHGWAADAVEVVRPTYRGTVEHFAGLEAVAAAFDSIEAGQFDRASEQVALARDRLEAAAGPLGSDSDSRHDYFEAARHSYRCLTTGYLEGVDLARESVAAFQRGDQSTGEERLEAASDRLAQAREECDNPTAATTQTGG